MNKKCHTLYGSSTTACSFKILCGERANELGRTQGETERRQKFLRTIFAFITLETTKVIGRVLPSTNHLLFCDGPCDLSVASSCFDDTQISFFSSKNSDTKIFFAAPLQGGGFSKVEQNLGTEKLDFLKVEFFFVQGGPKKKTRRSECRFYSHIEV